MKKRLITISLLISCSGQSLAIETSHGWKDTEEDRLKALAVVQTLRADLTAAKSATIVLEQWCADHKQANPPKIRAIRDTAAQKPAPEDVRELLNVSAQETVRYRSVRLMCGHHIFSEADNWYVPSRLTASMNEQLETTDIPFGIAVKSLNYSRRTTDSRVLWEPLEKGWEMKMPALPKLKHRLAIPLYILKYRATLLTPENLPFSVVDESYRNDLLNFR